MVKSSKSAPLGAAKKKSGRGYPVFSFVVCMDGLPPLAVEVGA